MTGRGMGFPEARPVRYRKDRKVCHVKCVFYISEMSEKGIASCKFCGVQYQR